MSIASRAFWLLVRAYQMLRAGYPPVCRYIPSCSNYALEAVEHHGVIRGIGLALRRICRCHPWGGSGWDPVPISCKSSSVPKECSDV